MTLLLGTDLETTGLDASRDKIIEVAAVLWNVERKAPVNSFSFLIKQKQDFDLPSDITGLTGITDRMLGSGNTLEFAMEQYCALADKADFQVAHNAEFEKSFFQSHHYGFVTEATPWIDTAVDLPVEGHVRSASLESYCYTHRVLNPFPHRALFDTLVMLQVLSGFDFEKVVDRSQQETFRLIAEVSIREKDKAKAIGYRWEPTERIWWKPVKEGDFEKEKARAAEAGFGIYKSTLEPNVA